jgi:molybdate transport system substrate-binding protein
MKVKMIKLLILSLFLSFSLLAKDINIAVAANVSYAIEELKAEFKKRYPDIGVKIILGSSGKLTAQIKNGAPYGVFMSADMRFPHALYEDKLAISKPVVYTKGALALLSVKKLPLATKGIMILKDKSIKLIAIANPKTAPYGKAAFEVLKNLNIYDDIKSKFIYGESISQTVSYTVVAADIGIVAKSSLFSKNMTRFKKSKDWISIDSTLYTPIKQGIVLLKSSKNSKEYKAFYDFILSDKAKEIFKKYGYLS